MGFYERHILPPLLNMAMSAKPITYQRRKVVPQASGRVLEIGMGAGHNIPFYDRAKVSELIGLEPSPGLRSRAQRTAHEAGMKVDFIGLKAEEIPLADESVDTVLVTYTLCTIPDVPRALAGMKRVLKPGGCLIFCEHGEAPDPGVKRWQGRINPIWKRIAGGCNLHRPIPSLLREGGFAIDKMETMYLPSTPRFAGYNYWGSARKA
ncbi:MAG: class I SAM-dependent methyltransferase [Alphaproteobacteria bacterium]|nr:class I SAM-dependent methyltransferase [Alphaproteobacteria bacterium]